jgi:hypothetical protein
MSWRSSQPEEGSPCDACRSRPRKIVRTDFRGREDRAPTPDHVYAWRVSGSSRTCRGKIRLECRDGVLIYSRPGNTTTQNYKTNSAKLFRICELTFQEFANLGSLLSGMRYELGPSIRNTPWLCLADSRWNRRIHHCGAITSTILPCASRSFVSITSAGECA